MSSPPTAPPPAPSGSSEPRRPSSFIDDHGAYSSTCGYCSSVAKTSRSHGVSAHVLSVGDYQSLIDHGWRRSGGWLYRPELKETCCRAYTIRLETEKFAPTRGQKRVERKLEAYLCGGGGKDAADADADAARRGGGKSADAPAGDAAATAIEAAVRRALTAAGSTPGLITDPTAPPPSVKARRATAKAATRAGATHQCGVALVLRRGDAVAAEAAAAALRDVLGADAELARAGVELVRGGGGGGFLNFKAAAAAAAAGGGGGVGETRAAGSGASDAPKKSEKKKTLTISTAPSTFVREEFDLYVRYQTAVHGDDPSSLSKHGYARFLVDSPLTRAEAGEGVATTRDAAVGWLRVDSEKKDAEKKYHEGKRDAGVSASSARDVQGLNHVQPIQTKASVGGEFVATAPSCGFGAFHQQYRIDGKLVAVGVVDVLPLSLSSKYFFWDPEYAFLSLGKVRDATRRDARELDRCLLSTSRSATSPQNT